MVKGPCQFMPAVGEDVHAFTWSGTATGSTLLVRSRSTFHVLKTAQNREWRISLPVNTKDHADFYLNLTLIYRLAESEDGSLERLLQYEDPIISMYNGLVADLTLFGNTVTSDRLRTEESETLLALVSLDAYLVLRTAAESAGFCDGSGPLEDHPVPV